MAWFSDLAGHAENLLNKLDTEAAKTLSGDKRSSRTTGTTPPHQQQEEHEIHHWSSPHTPQHKLASSVLPSSWSVPGSLNTYGGGTMSSQPAHSLFTDVAKPMAALITALDLTPPQALVPTSVTNLTSAPAIDQVAVSAPNPALITVPASTSTPALITAPTSTPTSTPTAALTSKSSPALKTASALTPTLPPQNIMTMLNMLPLHTDTDTATTATTATSCLEEMEKEDGSKLVTIQVGGDSSGGNSTHCSVGHSRHSSVSSVASFLTLAPATPAAGGHADVNTVFTRLTLEGEPNGGGVNGSSDGSSVASSAGQLESFVSVEPSVLVICPPPSTASSTASQAECTEVGGGEAVVLRAEVFRLTEERTQLLARTTAAEREAAAAKAVEKQHRDAQNTEITLKRSVESSNSAAAMLRDRLHEADVRHEAQEGLMQQLRRENTSLCRGAGTQASQHSSALSQVQERLVEAQSTLKRAETHHAITEDALSSRITVLERTQRGLVTEAREAGQRLQTERCRHRAILDQVSGLKAGAAEARAALAEYKAKAARVLHTKDELISSLKKRDGGVGLDHEELVHTDLEQLRVELELSREEVDKASAEASRAQAEVAEAGRLAEVEAVRQAEVAEETETDLAEFRRQREDSEEEARQARQEARVVGEELRRMKVQVGATLQQREAELDKLRKQLSHRQSSSSSEEQLEEKIRGLTESVVRKQSDIERLSTELQARTCQMERLQRQYDQALLSTDQTQHRFYGAAQDGRSRAPTLVVESPFDGNVKRRMKRAYTSLERLSLGLGGLLRRYPTARLLVLLYMLALHLWVVLVLLTYTPEVHAPDYQDPLQPRHPPLPDT